MAAATPPISSVWRKPSCRLKWLESIPMAAKPVTIPLAAPEIPAAAIPLTQICQVFMCGALSVGKPEFRAVLYSELAENGADVELHRARGDPQQLRDLFVAPVLSQQLVDLELAPRQQHVRRKVLAAHDVHLHRNANNERAAFELRFKVIGHFAPPCTVRYGAPRSLRHPDRIGGSCRRSGNA